MVTDEKDEGVEGIGGVVVVEEEEEERREWIDQRHNNRRVNQKKQWIGPRVESDRKWQQIVRMKGTLGLEEGRKTENSDNKQRQQQ